MHLFLRLRNRHFLAIDIVLLSIIPTVALVLRTGKLSWSDYGLGLILFTALALVVKLPLFHALGLYRRYWRYASVDELYTIILAVGEATGIVVAIFLGAQALRLIPGGGLPRSIPFIDGMLTLMAVGGTRFSVRASESARRARGGNGTSLRKRVLVVGAGDAGAMIVREMRSSTQVNLEPVGFVDDDRQKQGVAIHGIPVLGSREDIPKLVKEYGIQEVIIAMPAVPGRIIREILVLCEAVEVPTKTIPGMYEILSGQVTVGHLRNVDIEDLLRREPVQIDSDDVARMVAGTRVLVTGAGGSIGSELCRQIMWAGPARLTLLGHGENSLFFVSHELRRMRPEIALDVLVADVRDRSRLEAIFRRCQPQLVFHAAAHKHVPLMEDNVEDAVTNNVLGTRNLVRVAEATGIERFVLISTDKAVNPVSVMGATKRVAELIVRQAGRRSERPFVSVRFGNVLGSRGSVVPLFRQQIERGGPLTVTHPEMRRFFMTIPEAAQLVLQAAALGENGQVFLLDMGQPLKIVDLARDLIELSGLQVGEDIDIVFTGLRPGEKLLEELFIEDEEYSRTKHEKILVTTNDARGVNPGSRNLDEAVGELVKQAQVGQVEAVRAKLREIVPEYQPVIREAV